MLLIGNGCVSLSLFSIDTTGGDYLMVGFMNAVHVAALSGVLGRVSPILRFYGMHEEERK